MSLETPVRPPITFTANFLDRVSIRRKDPDWVADRMLDRKSRYLPISELKALIALDPGPALDWRPVSELAEPLADGADCILLGMDEGVCHFAVDVSRFRGRQAGWGKFIDVRSIAPQLAAGEAGILAQARAMIDWHQRHRFCANCGAPSRMAEAGYVRRCSNEECKADHFPRTDPVVIMMAIRGEECLLGRQPRFPQGTFSALAGFMEPGESIEEAVRREIMEEAGVQIGAVRYVASQPWPFPSSLMIGCFGEALSADITVDHEELEDARWFSRDQIAQMLKNSLGTETPRMPPPLSLAHQLAKAWIEGR